MMSTFLLWYLRLDDKILQLSHQAYHVGIRILSEVPMIRKLLDGLVTKINRIVPLRILYELLDEERHAKIIIQFMSQYEFEFDDEI